MDTDEKKKFIQELGISESLFEEMLVDCLIEIRAAFVELRDAFAAGDLEKVKSAAHLIKGTAGNFRLQGVHFAAADLHDHLKKNKDDSATLLAMIDRIDRELRNL